MPLMPEYNRESIKTSILGKLQRYDGCSLEEATPKQVYKAVASTVRDQIMQKWRFEKEARKNEKAKRLYYLSIEFLTGRWLHNNMLNLAATEVTRPPSRSWHQDGGCAAGRAGARAGQRPAWARLAACFMDSLATLDLPAMGCSIRYEYASSASASSTAQVELPDSWLEIRQLLGDIPGP